MPAAIIAVGAAAAGWGAAAGILGAAAAGTFSFMAIATVVGTAVSYGLSAVFAVNGEKRTNNSQDRKQIIRSSVEPRQIVYGRARVSGPMIYASSSGPDLRYLHLVIPLAGHEVDRIGTVWINDVAVNDGDLDGDGNVVANGHQLNGKCRVRKYRGDQTSADPNLVAESTDGWSSSHVLRGVAYLYLRLEYSQDAYPSGLTGISAEVFGRKVYDPRTGATAYSTNWALCVLDYLKADFGLACKPDEVDEGSFAIAANVSDELVQLNAEATEWQSRYTMDGAIKLDETPMDIIEKMMTAGGGALVYVQGRYQLHAGAYVAPTDVLTVSDVAGDMEIVTKPSRSALFNSVKGTFIDPGQSWQSSEFPAFEASFYIGQDGEKIWKEVEFPFTIDGTRCQRLAKQLVLTERESLTISVPVKYRGLRFSVMQNVAVQMPDLGWNNKPFRVKDWTFDPVTGGVSLVLQEDGAGSYGWLYDDAASIPPSPDTDLINPLNIPAPTNLQLQPTTGMNADGAAVPALLVTWTPAQHAFVTSHEVQWRVAPNGPWSSAEVPAPTARYSIMPVVVGQALDVRVRAIGGIVRGPWTGIATGAGERDTTPPGPPGGASVTAAIQQFVIRWINPPDSDLAKVEVYESTNDSFGDAYKQGESTSDFFVRNVAAGSTRWFWLRALDRSGNASPVVYAGTGTARATQTADIQPGAVSGLDFAEWDGPGVRDITFGDGTFPLLTVVTIRVSASGDPTSDGGENPQITYPKVQVTLRLDGTIVAEGVMPASGSIVLPWGAPAVPPGTHTLNIAVSTIGGAVVHKVFAQIQTAKR